MPSSIVHRCVSKRVLEKTKIFIDDKDKYLYDVGSIAPDSWRNTKRFKDSDLPKKLKRMHSHFSEEDKFIEKYPLFYDKYKKDITNPFMTGYLVHLITDNFWRTDIYQNVVCNSEKNRQYLSEINIDYRVILNNDIKKSSKYLIEYYKLKELKYLTDDEINSLPIMSELEYEGVNDTISFYNNQVSKIENKESLELFIENDFVNAIERCTNYIINKLEEYNINNQ